MKLTRYTDIHEFTNKVEPFLVEHETENNVLLGLCSQLAKSMLNRIPPYLGCVEHNGAVIAVGIMTPPYPLGLSWLGNPAALKLLAGDVQAFCASDLHGVTGLQAISKAFADLWQQRTGQSYHIFVKMRLYRLDMVQPVKGVSGEYRPMTAAECGLVADWIYAFNKEATEPITREDAQRRAENILDADPTQRGMRLWWDSGKPVSMACYTGPTPHSIRIADVYTPPECRQRGYARAITAAISQEVLDKGWQFCTLYTDLNNPTSNRIYQEIGYKPLADVDAYHFDKQA